MQAAPSSKAPVLFIAHGSPDILLQQDPVIDAWRGACAQADGLKRILVVSAHWTTPALSVGGNRHRQTIHDFHGFPEALYEMRYAPPEDTGWAEELAQRLGLALDQDRGLDHGAWVPLKACFEEAQLPVTQLSVAPGQGFEAHHRLGQKLADLREEGVLILASGVIVHNLARADLGKPMNTRPETWARDFMAAVDEAVAAGDADTLCDPMSLEGAVLSVPTTEHYLPLLVAAGAAGDDRVQGFASVWRFANLSQHSYRWGWESVGFRGP